MKSVAALLTTTLTALADTSILSIPENRGAPDTAYAEWDTFDGFNTSNGTGTSPADNSHNLTSPELTQTSPLSFPGGVKYTTATDKRLYTFDSATNWSLSATSNISYNSATLRSIELLDGTRDPNEIPEGLTPYTITLNGQLPTSISVQAVTDEIEANGFTFERSLAITTITWSLPSPTTTLSLNLLGPADSHDSLDAFVLDLETSAQSPPTPDLSVNGTQITLSWPDTSNATLQQTTNLNDLQSWQNVPEPVVTGNGLHSVSLPLTSNPTFFRLTN